jgi:hypothetical protein
MSSIAEATPIIFPIILTSEERTELESLARLTKTEYRARVKARIDGGGCAATRGITRYLQGKKSDVLRLQEPRRRPQDNQG